MKKIIAIILFLVSLNLGAVDGAVAACTSSSTSGAVKVGSVISGGSVVICASTTSAAKTATTATNTSTNAAKSTTVKKVVTPVVVAPKPCVIEVPSTTAAYGLYVSGCTVKVVAPVTYVAPKVTATVATPVIAIAVSSASDQAAFTPDPVGISASPNAGQVGQAFFFSAIAGSHTKSGTVLGKSAQVSFTPVGFSWSASSGGGSGVSFVTNWNSEGSQSVTLVVDYAVSYSVGAGWIDAGSIRSSASTSVQVNSVPVVVVPPTPPKPPLLVSANCQARPSSYRC